MLQFAPDDFRGYDVITTTCSDVIVLVIGYVDILRAAQTNLSVIKFASRRHTSKVCDAAAAITAAL